LPQADSFRFDDLDAVPRDGSPDKRVDMRLRVMDFFFSGADRLNGGQIGGFDAILVQPIQQDRSKSASGDQRPTAS